MAWIRTQDGDRLVNSEAVAYIEIVAEASGDERTRIVAYGRDNVDGLRQMSWELYDGPDAGLVLSNLQARLLTEHDQIVSVGLLATTERF